MPSPLHGPSDPYFLTHLKAVNSSLSTGAVVHGSIINDGWFHPDDGSLEEPEYFLESRWSSSTELHQVL